MRVLCIRNIVILCIVRDSACSIISRIIMVVCVVCNICGRRTIRSIVGIRDSIIIFDISGVCSMFGIVIIVSIRRVR